MDWQKAVEAGRISSGMGAREAVFVLLSSACLVACGASERNANETNTTGSTVSASNSAPSGTSTDGNSSSSTSAGTSGSTSEGAGGTSSGVDSTANSSVGGAASTTTEAAATISTGFGGGPVCGDVACGYSFYLRIAPPVPLAELSGAEISVCVDDACSTGSFPEFTLDDQLGYYPDASFVTPPGDHEYGFYVETYVNPDILAISNDGVEGERLVVSFESAAGEELGTVEGALEVVVYDSECLYCETTSFSNLPDEE